MEFLLLFNEREGGPQPDEEGFARMAKYSDELRRRGVLRRGAPLAEASEGAIVRVRDGEVFITDGPFPETKELIAGFWIVDVADRAAALEIARHCPHLGRGPIEIHAVGQRHSFPDSGRDTPYLFAFRVEPGLSDSDGSKLREMLAFTRARAAEGSVFETAPLRSDPPAAHLALAAGTTVVKDGPFVETKDMIGGYSLVRAPGRAEAIDLARRTPHATWGPIEVRRIPFFDPV